MDYEKKYNEALKRAEAAINIAADKDLVKGVATTIFPELAESEDERTRKELIEQVEKSKHHPADKERWISYLEKQKDRMTAEEFESSELFQLKLKTKYANGYQDGLAQKEQKPADKFQEYLNASPAERRKMNMDEILGDNKGHQKTTDALTTDSNKEADTSDCKYKNLDDIAQEYVDGVRHYNPEPTWDLMQTAVCYGYHLAEQKKQKPAEWSKEEEKMIERLITRLNWITYNTRTDGTSPNITFFDEIDWLKSLRPQPKAELSEDVKKTLDEVSHILVGLNYKQIAKDYKQAIEKLLHSRSSWKPSEEQMEALRVTIDFMPDTFKPRCTLITLQNGLEKLM